MSEDVNHGESLGDAVMIRRIVEQVVSATQELEKRNLDERIAEHIETAVEKVELRMNRRLLGAVIANAIPMIVGAFFLGGLWVKFAEVPSVLDGRAVWMRNMETRTIELERHADRTDPLYEKPDTVILPD